MTDGSVILFGQEITDIPPDLFIPPDALFVILQQFEGPLDLLLYLIRRQNLDILDIPVIEITRQYLAYIAHMERAQMDLAAEYLLMASLLIEIKSRLLLPRPAAPEENEEDPRAELARRLLVYEQMKAAAEKLDQLPQAGRDFFWITLPQETTVAFRQPEVSLADLGQAWLHVLHRARQFQNHTITAEPLSVREQMSEILRRLDKGGELLFQELFDTAAGAALAVTTFIALLELVRESLVSLRQSAAFAPIYVQAA